MPAWSLLDFVLLSMKVTKIGAMSSSWPELKASSRLDLIERDTRTTILAVPTKMNYVTKGTTHPHTKRDETGSDSTVEGVEWQQEEVIIHNGRSDSQTYSIDDNGFELMTSQLNDDIHFYNQTDVLDRYYPHCETLLTRKFGSNVKVIAFDHNLRSNGSRRNLDNSNAMVQNPLGIVHADYTRISAPRRLYQLSLAPKTNDVRKNLGILLDPKLAEECLQGRQRFVFCNVWRNIKESPVEQLHLACIDAKSVHWRELRTFKIHYVDRTGENYFACPSKSHKWVYFPQMHKSEALLLKQWDSYGDLAQGKELDDHVATFAVHSAFVDPTSSEDLTRESIEVRCVAIWPSNEEVK